MKKINLYSIVFMLCFAFASLAKASVQRFTQDIKLPSQVVIEKQSASPSAASTNNILSAHAGATEINNGVLVTSFLAQPDVPRNVVITPAGDTAAVRPAPAIVYGKDYFGRFIQETIAFTDGQATASVGSLAFYQIDSILLPAEQGSFGATWSVGTGSKLGLKRCMDQPGHLIFGVFNGVYEATRPTVVAGASVASTTAQLNSSLNGSQVDLFFIQNYKCL